MCKPAHFRFTYNYKQGYFGGKFELFTLLITSLLTHKTVQSDSLEIAVNKNILFH